MKRKGYKTSPSIRVPKSSVAKLHAAAAAARDLEQERLAHSYTRAALHKAVQWIDLLKDGGKPDGWTHADLKELEQLRFLSLG